LNKTCTLSRRTEEPEIIDHSA